MIASDETPGGCWTHYSSLRVEGFRELTEGQEVEFEWEHVTDQDGYTFRTTAAWPRGQTPAEPPDVASEPGAAYRSRVTIDGLDPEDWPPSDPGAWRRS